MKFILISITFLMIGCANAKVKDTYEGCDVKYTKISLKVKDDFRIVSESCNEENPIVINYLEGSDQKIFINKYDINIGKWLPKLEAVSVYKKDNQRPLLITLHTQVWDSPTVNGILYNVNLYEIYLTGKRVRLVDVSNILGNSQSGLEGVSDDYMHFKFKDIASIKKWLDKNYK
ncbi:hypothetical protein [Acinetobacter courvalinii]|uniref:hypothetical protein n=1 Tax=Acinetobacter courvalinii TaxID=280147 RepID=UPI0018FFBC3B|nr:hypothetical protein [Acinetobacter courvalinii]MBJ8417072.1 hypothetical protein [Acinetobacter courvalinii]